MAYCRKCGAQISDYASVCPECGAAQNSAPDTPPVVDNGGFLWGLLGCCIPIVGLILFLVWKDTKPRTAKAAGFSVVAMEDAISTQGKGQGETPDGIARAADLYLRDYGELIAKLAPEEDGAQGLFGLLE